MSEIEAIQPEAPQDVAPVKQAEAIQQVALSVCIPTYNRARYLENLLAELVSQIGELKFSYELLIGDNCSTDATEEVVGRYQDKLNIRCFRRPSNLGSAENLNQLYRSAQGKYVLYRLASTAVADLWVRLRQVAQERLAELRHRHLLQDLHDGLTHFLHDAADAAFALIRASTRGVELLTHTPYRGERAFQMPNDGS